MNLNQINRTFDNAKLLELLRGVDRYKVLKAKTKHSSSQAKLNFNKLAKASLRNNKAQSKHDLIEEYNKVMKMSNMIPKDKILVPKSKRLHRNRLKCTQTNNISESKVLDQDWSQTGSKCSTYKKANKDSKKANKRKRVKHNLRDFITKQVGCQAWNRNEESKFTRFNSSQHQKVSDPLVFEKLYNRGQALLKSKEKLSESASKARKEKELEECTFYPRLISSKSQSKFQDNYDTPNF